MDAKDKLIAELTRRVDRLEKRQIYHTDIPPGTVKPRHLGVGEQAEGDLYYSNGGEGFVRIPAGTEGQVLTMIDGIPTWQ